MTIASPVPANNTLLQQRRLAVSKSATVIGLDYVRIRTDPSPTLVLYFIAKANSANPSVPTTLQANNIQITVKQPGSAPINTFLISNPSTQVGDSLTFPIDNPSSSIDPKDDTIYTLSLVNTDGLTPFTSVDVFLSQVDFSISLNSQTRSDGLPIVVVENAVMPTTPEIDYLSRDYLSFRQLMLDRLAALVPDWQASHEADLGSVIIEILAYAADYLSYYQDAVATEAYLDTARSRISIRRHARLLDYQVSEGCNARAWVQVAVNIAMNLPKGTLLCTRSSASPDSISPGVISPDSEALVTLQTDSSVVWFATLYDTYLQPEHNSMSFYTWGSPSFSLAQGATRATLKGNFSHLKQGDVLAFVPTKGADTGLAIDTNLSQRCVVRLKSVTVTSDPLFVDSKTGKATEVTEITWSGDDALPFEVVITKVTNGAVVTDISMALGNMVLTDHGSKVENEKLSPVSSQGNYHPILQQPNLTFTEPFNNETAIEQNYGASQATEQDPHATVPAVTMTDSNGQHWYPQPDLLTSNYASTNFVAEMEDNRMAHLRFGDGIFGKRPDPNTIFHATYRIGNGVAGNIGAESLVYVVVAGVDQNAVERVYNPLPARGGIDPMTTQQIKLYAPKANKQLIRCVTPQDYVQIAKNYHYHDPTTGQDYSIQDVSAVLRWTGSWYTTFIAIALQGGQPLSDGFKQNLQDYLAKYQLMHQAFEIISPQWVPLTIVLPVTVKTSYTPNAVLKSLMQKFSSMPGGLFYPDNFKFGQTIYLSEIVDAVMKTPGVLAVDITPGSGAVFKRFGTDGLVSQKILINPLEIAQVNNQILGGGSIQFILRQEIMS